MDHMFVDIQNVHSSELVLIASIGTKHNTGLIGVDHLARSFFVIVQNLYQYVAIFPSRPTKQHAIVGEE